MDIKQSTDGSLVSAKPLLEYQPDLTEWDFHISYIMKVNHNTFSISHQSPDTDTNNKFYTNQEHSEFLDSGGFYRSENDNEYVFAKALKDKLSKSITNKNKNYSYYIKASPNKVLYDARKLYTIEPAVDKNFINNTCKNDQTFIQVSEAIFNKYINFLKTGNTQWLNQAQREIK